MAGAIPIVHASFLTALFGATAPVTKTLIIKDRQKSSNLKFQNINQRTLTFFKRGSITAQLTSCLFCLDSAALLMLN